MKIIRAIRQMLCRHEYERVNGERLYSKDAVYHLYRCKKCGKEHYRLFRWKGICW
jgi:hypothetical protein